MTHPTDPSEPSEPLDPARPGPGPADAPPPLYGTPPADDVPPAASPYGASPYGAPPGVPPTYGAAPVPPYPYGGAAPTQGNNLGTWALVLGIVGVVLSCTCALPGLAAAIPAIVLGGKGKTAAAQGLATNGSTASAGVVLGWVGVGLAVPRTLTSVANGLGSVDLG